MLRDRRLIPLSQQHHNGLALCVLTERSLREDLFRMLTHGGSAPSRDHTAGNVAKCARKAIDRYELELTNRFEIEERILFPAIESPLIDGLISDCCSIPWEKRSTPKP